MNRFRLDNKVALVTGGAVNIGRGIALGLADAGAKVAVAYHSHQDEAKALSSEIGWGRALPFTLDASKESSVRSAMEAVVNHFGGLDILVNNAGIFSLSPQSELSVAEWDRIFQVNVRGLFLCSREAARIMRGRDGAAIINIASINGFHPGFGNTAHYDASKGAVIAYTRSLASELAPQGIRVNGIAPGLVDSPLLREHAADLASMVEERTPLKCLAEPQDIADAAVYLASPASRHVTGETIIIDGGYLLT